MKPTSLRLANCGKNVMGRWVAGVWMLGLCIAAPASAATVQRDYLSHGASACHASRSSDEALLRRSAMGLSNIGTAPVFLTCDFDVAPNVPNLDPSIGIDMVAIGFLNQTSTDVSVKCTLASGILHVATYSSKTAVAARNSGAAGVLSWFAADDNGGEAIAAPALGCLLPPSVEVVYTLVRATEEAGQ